MAQRKIEIELRAKNALQRGLSQAGATLKKFGQSALRIGKFFAKGFLAAGAAVAGFAAKALHAYAGKEKAERAVIASLQAHGEAGEALLPMYKRMADAIQRETGLNDETTLQRASAVRMLGVQTHQMEEAMKGMVALTRAGMGEESAQRAIAAAMQGNYTMLTRYIPELRNATDEADKARIVNDFLAKGYDAQTKELDTVSGQYNLLKENLSDVWAEMGRAISQNDALMNGIKRAQLAVAEFATTVSDWVERGGVVNLIAGFKLFYTEVRFTFQRISNTVAIVFASIADGAQTVVRYVTGIFEAQSQLIAGNFTRLSKAAIAAWEAMRRPSRESARAMMDASREVYEGGKADLQNLGRAYAGHGAAVTERTEAQLALREEIHRDHADRVAQISADQAAGLIEHEEKQTAAAEAAREAEVEVAKQAAEHKVRISAESAEEIGSIEEDLTELMRDENAERVRDAEQSAELVTNAWRRAADGRSQMRKRESHGAAMGAGGAGLTYAEMAAMQAGRRVTRDANGRIVAAGTDSITHGMLGVGAGSMGPGLMGASSMISGMRTPEALAKQTLDELKAIHRDQTELLRWH